MRQAILGGLIALLLAALGLRAEEILLRDGTKVVGKMVAIKGDFIEVKTPYGKMRLHRADIVSIEFPENQPKSEPASEPPKVPTPVEEKLDGTSYTNRTGKFSLTVPAGWKISNELRESPGSEALAALTSADGTRAFLVVQEEFSGSLEAYKGLLELSFENRFTRYKKLSESPVTIDGQPGLLVYVSIVEPESKLPFAYMVAIVGYGTEMVKMTGFCVEPLFNESQKMFETIILSYRRIGE